MFKIYYSADAICMGSATGDVGDIVPLTFGTWGYRGVNENDLPGD